MEGGAKSEAESGYNAVLFPFIAVVFGTVTLQLFSRLSIQLSHTVAVMAIGVVFSYLLNTASAYHWARTVAHSTNAWANIEGNVILFSFLPALLFGDAMALNIHTFRVCFLQSVILGNKQGIGSFVDALCLKRPLTHSTLDPHSLSACPGVIVGALIMGVAAYFVLPFGWDFSLCMTFGSILSATDPVAALTMLKALGAGRMMSAQITGEALLNDGTAMVLFHLFWKAHSSGSAVIPEAGRWDVLESFLRMVVGAPLVGRAVGWAAYLWLASASQKHSERNVTVQLSVTLCTAYLSYFLGEELGVSGVITCVSAALFLAQHAWPVISSRTSMESVWHALVYFMNTIVFFLAGVITQRAVHTSFHGHSFGSMAANLAGFVVIMTIARAAMIVMAYPVLNLTGPRISVHEASFMVWAGLRGAVGLALALVVLQDGRDKRAGQQLVAMVSGLSFLTIVLQGSTCGAVLRYWRMLEVDTEKASIMQTVAAHIEVTCAHLFARRSASAAAADADRHNHSTIDAFSAVHYIHRLRMQRRSVEESVVPVNMVELGPMSGLDAHLGAYVEQPTTAEAGPFLTLAELERDCAGSVEGAPTAQLTAMREIHYRIVMAEYWKQLKDGRLPRESRAPSVLIDSIQGAGGGHGEYTDFRLLDYSR